MLVQIISRITTRRDWKLNSADYERYGVSIAFIYLGTHSSLTILRDVVVYKSSQSAVLFFLGLLILSISQHK